MAMSCGNENAPIGQQLVKRDSEERFGQKKKQTGGCGRCSVSEGTSETGHVNGALGQTRIDNGIDTGQAFAAGI